ncbi:unnamed protein product [Adineta ricciae]|uniref:Uncharacterized protein n=1 Tax=Adineta ricciae TaxID=249248 RepID=A0A814IAF8_ADIRI|nr:unnamed protein product [Adineta ricciae]CAF1493332.1 unnamed protein product [Adineta ricciae]
MLSHRTQPGAYIFVADQFPPKDGHTVSFLHQPTRVITGAERLAKTTGAVVVYAGGGRPLCHHGEIHGAAGRRHPRNAAALALVAPPLEAAIVTVLPAASTEFWPGKPTFCLRARSNRSSTTAPCTPACRGNCCRRRWAGQWFYALCLRGRSHTAPCLLWVCIGGCRSPAFHCRGTGSWGRPADGPF